MTNARGTVLLVEDEVSVGNLLRHYLSRERYAVVWVQSGEEALAELGRHSVSLVVLDIGLPGMDGFDVCREIRARSAVPVIMLTARDEEVDRVAGLELGADDYVTKPFSPRELVARIKAVLRRVARSRTASVIGIGPLRVDGVSREVTVDDRPVELTAREFDLLLFFVQNPGVALSRDVLLDRVWGMEFPGGTRTVDVHVGQLRHKLGTEDLIETVRGAGYRLSRRLASLPD